MRVLLSCLWCEFLLWWRRRKKEHIETFLTVDGMWVFVEWISRTRASNTWIALWVPLLCVYETSQHICPLAQPLTCLSTIVWYAIWPSHHAGHQLTLVWTNRMWICVCLPRFRNLLCSMFWKLNATLCSHKSARGQKWNIILFLGQHPDLCITRSTARLWISNIQSFPLPADGYVFICQCEY